MNTCQVLDMTITMVTYTQLPIMKITNTSPLGGIIDLSYRVPIGTQCIKMALMIPNGKTLVV
jgi:hypothetical protein